LKIKIIQSSFPVKSTGRKSVNFVTSAPSSLQGNYHAVFSPSALLMSNLLQ
jgi:hypothetical protein